MMRGVLFRSIRSLFIVGFMGFVPMSVTGQVGDCAPETTACHYLHLAHTRSGAIPLRYAVNPLGMGDMAISSFDTGFVLSECGNYLEKRIIIL